jgi:hypothetical protein
MKTNQLNVVLKVNAISSGVTGMILIFFRDLCSSLFEVTASEIFLGVGIFLLIFAVYVFAESTRKDIHARRVQFISALDILWVVASDAILIIFWKNVSVIGNLLIFGVALWVAAMAYLQLSGVKKQAQPERV